MKKSISVVTYHKAYNYGALLQAYSTQCFFENNRYDCRIVDYSPEYLKNYGKLKNTYNQRGIKEKKFPIRIIYTLIKNISYKKQIRVFNPFMDKYLKLTPNYQSLEDLKEKPPLSNVYCTGSDQVWNNYYSTNFDETFFLEFVPTGKTCISFASSFGKDNFSNEENNFLKEKLEKYSLITTREKSGVEILKNIGYKKAKLLLDPTLLLETNFWENFSDVGVKYKKEKYILVYQLHGDSDCFEKAIEFSKKKNIKVYRIITMYHQIRLGSKNIILPSMEEFISLIRNAEYVFTDSFHGTVFSLVFKRKLGVRTPANFGNRITSLLGQIKGEKFIINDLESWDDNITENYIEECNDNLLQVQKENIKMIKEELKKVVK